MTNSGRGRGATYAESTKLQIIRAVLGQPGCTGRQIAESLGLDRSRVNSFLYGEGKRRFGLVVSNWRWYAGQASEPSVVSSTLRKPTYWVDRVYERDEPRKQQFTNAVDRAHDHDYSPLKDSVCSILSSMSITNATLKIRTLSLTLVELAFGEDEYPALDERLQAELIIRKKGLEEASKDIQVIRHGPNRWLWVVIVVLGVWVLTLLGNQKSVEYPNKLQQRGGADPVLHGK
jgi:hypothetical protein